MLNKKPCVVVKVNQNNTSVGRKTKTMIDLTDQSCWVKAELAVIFCGRPPPLLHMKKISASAV